MAVLAFVLYGAMLTLTCVKYHAINDIAQAGRANANTRTSDQNVMHGWHLSRSYMRAQRSSMAGIQLGLRIGQKKRVCKVVQVALDRVSYVCA